MLTETKMTTDLALVYWGMYANARRQQIEQERQQSIYQGQAPSVANMLAKKRLQDLDNEFRARFQSTGEWLREWSLSVAHDMAQAFEENFYQALIGKFEGFAALFEDLFRALMQRVAALAAKSMDNILAKVIGAGFDQLGIGDPFKNTTTDIPIPVPLGDDYSGTPEFATGGIVMSPTLARVGEVPEAIIPLSKLNNAAFQDRFGTGGGQQRQVNATMIIQTPDPAAFNRSKHQALNEFATMLGRANQRNS